MPRPHPCDLPTWTRRRRALLVGVLAPLALVAACGSGGSDAEPATTTEATTTTTEVSIDEVGEAYQDLVDEVGEAIDDEAAERDGFADDNDLDGAIDSATGLVDAVEDFQAGLADLELPEDEEDLTEAIEAVDDATTDYLEALADYADVTEVADYNDQLDAEVEVAKAWRAAVADAAEALDVDGLDDGGGSEDEDRSDDGSDEDGGSGGLVEGDGSEYCLQPGDLPDGFLQVAGQDNLSNALGFVMDDGPEAAYADSLVASWMALPDGGAGPDELTADCVIHIFDSVEAAEGFYDAWTTGYGADSSPPPEPAEVYSGAPGEDPLAFTNEIGGRPDATQLFRYENAVVSVGISGTSSNDIETLIGAVNDLANLVHDRLTGAG